jgi:hypothetical protein
MMHHQSQLHSLGRGIAGAPSTEDRAGRQISSSPPSPTVRSLSQRASLPRGGYGSYRSRGESMSGGERPERLSIRLFGPLTIVDGQRALGARDLGGSRPKQVLEILLAARGHLVPSERLAELLWGAAPPRNPTGSLQTFISVLRQRLVPDRDRGRELIVTEAEAYRCSADLIELDLDRFDTCRGALRCLHEATTARRYMVEDPHFPLRCSVKLGLSWRQVPVAVSRRRHVRPVPCTGRVDGVRR